MTRLPQRFWDKVEKTDSCWLWLGTVSKKGYGGYSQNSRLGLAHRAAWIDVHGPVADGLELDHLCSVRRCVNPSHLEPVTHEENVRRAWDRRTTCRNGLHEKTAENRIVHSDGSSTCRPCRIAAMAANAENARAVRRAYRARKRVAA